jgi:hypothetical protein
MTLQLARLFDRGNRNFDERRLIRAVFLDVAKAIDKVWVKGPVYKVIVLNFPSYLVKSIFSYRDCQTFQTAFHSATPTCRGMRAGVAQGGLVSPVLFNLYVNDIPTPSRHVKLEQDADDTSLVPTSSSPSLLVHYPEAYFGRLERCLRDWRTAINVFKSTPVLFVKAARSIHKPREVQFLGEPIQWVQTARYLGVTLDTQLPGRRKSTRWERRQEKRPVGQKGRAALQAAHLFYDGLCISDLEVRCSLAHPEAARFTIQVSSHCDKRTLVR